jgi:hypothetical protein
VSEKWRTRLLAGLSDEFKRKYLRPDQLSDLTALFEAQTAHDAMSGDIEQRHEILSAFVHYVQQHSAGSWMHDRDGVRLSYAYARVVADSIADLVKREQEKRPKGRPEKYTQDQIAAALALLVRHRVTDPIRKLGKLLRISDRKVEQARAVGGYEIRERREIRSGSEKIRANAARHGDRYKRNRQVTVELLKASLRGQPAIQSAVGRIIGAQRRDDIRALAAEGYSLPKIARKLRRKPSYVLAIAKANGISL